MLLTGHLAPGRPAVLALMRRRRRQRRWSGGSPHLLSSQSLCIRRETPKETPTDVRHQTQSHTTTRTPRHPPPRPKPHSFGRAVCGLRFDNPERIIADLSIGTLRLCGLFYCLGAVYFVIKLPHEGTCPTGGPRLVVPIPIGRTASQTSGGPSGAVAQRREYGWPREK